MGIFDMDIKAITVLFVFVSSVFCSPWQTGAQVFSFEKSSDGTKSECNGPADCVNPKQDELAILVTGGQFHALSADLISTNGTEICGLSQMPHYKYYHTQSGLTACGGYGSDPEGQSCLKFQSGSWTTLTDNLVFERRYHSSWITPDGDILLIGGFHNATTTEIVYQNGTSIRSFDLTYDTVYACSIELPDMFILTGGEHSMKKVSQYSTSGWMDDLPELNEGRNDHGCGYFYNDNMERVFLVAGGYGGSGLISSTETLVEGDQGWNDQKPLPSGRSGLRGLSLPDTVIMTGGGIWDPGYTNTDEMLIFDPKTSNWILIGKMPSARSDHGASLVNMADVINFCN